MSILRWSLALFLCVLPMAAQTAPAVTATVSSADPFQALSFLEGTWEAKTEAKMQGEGAPRVQGRYTFAHELGGHILARRATTDPNCKGPVGFDCAHSDLLYVFQDAPGQPLKAIYFDNEGHVLHYSVSVSSPAAVTFLSEPGAGPQFRLVYELKGAVMTGKFQMHLPGQGEWRSYLEWSGTKL